MPQDHTPAPAMRIALRALPTPLLQRMIDVLVRSMRVGHPKLFRNLERLPSSVVMIDPSDLPHRFKLAYGNGETNLSIAEEHAVADAHIKGKLEALLSLLEGRIDGDKLFFTRDLEISGNTAVVVALRNTLDREEIDLLDDVSALFGPFARPMRAALSFMDKVTQEIHARGASLCDAKRNRGENARNEYSELRAEVRELKIRLAKLEGKRHSKKAGSR